MYKSYVQKFTWFAHGLPSWKQQTKGSIQKYGQRTYDSVLNKTIEVLHAKIRLKKKENKPQRLFPIVSG